MHHYQDLINIFNDCFTAKYNTKLMKGGDEPLYLPANEHQPYHTLFFAHGFFSSALHECAHWLIAGAERRQQVDFGYWYAPDGRTAEQQLLFQQAEVKPQALEWILSVATGHPFRVSIDNLDGEEAETEVFKHAVYEQVMNYCQQGLSTRATLFRSALCHFYETPPNLMPSQFEYSFTRTYEFNKE